MGSPRVTDAAPVREPADRWSTVEASELYDVASWGKGYFSVGDNGHVLVHPEKDATRVREATAGGADMAFDMVGGATDPHMTLAALRSLSDGGRLVLMGSMTVPLPLPYVETMLHGWEIIGNFMYPRDAYRRLLDLFRAGLLDPAAIEPRIFPLAALHDAMRAARSADSLECVVLDHTGE